jgi:hypothetical protein
VFDGGNEGEGKDGMMGCEENPLLSVLYKRGMFYLIYISAKRVVESITFL